MTGELPECQVVMVIPVHERIPAPSLIGSSEPHLDIAHHHLRPVERIRHAPVMDDAPRNLHALIALPPVFCPVNTKSVYQVLMNI